MLTDLKVKVGPQVYRYHEGAIDFVPTVLAEYQVKRLLIVHGTVSWEKAKPKMTFLKSLPIRNFLPSLYWRMQLLWH